MWILDIIDIGILSFPGKKGFILGVRVVKVGDVSDFHSCGLGSTPARR